MDLYDFYSFVCPHCQGIIIVQENELNCRIFRHGVFHNGEPVPPHAPQAECERLIAENLIVGCGKPFQVVTQSDGSELAVVCDYI